MGHFSMPTSYVNYPADGSTGLFTVPFEYLSRTHVYAFVDAVEVPLSFNSNQAVTISPTPADGSNVRIARITQTTPIVDFQNGETLTEANLDKITRQSLYLAEESADNIEAALQQDTDNLFNALNERIKNVADPIEPQDAVTRAWAENGMSSQLLLATQKADAAEASRQATVAIQTSLEGSLNFTDFDPFTTYTQAKDIS